MNCKIKVVLLALTNQNKGRRILLSYNKQELKPLVDGRIRYQSLKTLNLSLFKGIAWRKVQ